MRRLGHTAVKEYAQGHPATTCLSQDSIPELWLQGLGCLCGNAQKRWKRGDLQGGKMFLEELEGSCYLKKKKPTIFKRVRERMMVSSYLVMR